MIEKPAEGLVVVVGDLDQAKDGGGVYNVGVVGVGSRVPPPDGSDFLVVGGDLTVHDDNRLLAVEGTVSGVVRHAGAVSGTIEAADVVEDADALVPYAGLTPALDQASHCYGYLNGDRRPATGTVTDDGFGTVLFTGDGTSPIQIFAL